MLRKSLLAILLSFSLSFGGMAQEATPEVTEAPVEVVIVEEDATVLGTLEDPNIVEEDASNSLTGSALFLPFAATLVTLLTSILKPFVPIPSTKIALGLNIIIWVFYVLAKELFGDVGQFETITQSITTVLTTLIGTTGTSFLSSWFYDVNKKAEVPILGSDRPRD